ncbi:MAG: hypothetical protein QNJ63_05120 [Calothrix sp. MO_192.B10]|nr:hypothetical protein [Calothrix sp. MO_192.B10]
MKDNLSLIAAAAGGFMLSVTLASILHGAPVPSWQGKAHVHSSSSTTHASSSVIDTKELD